jgi:hypothetical protein
MTIDHRTVPNVHSIASSPSTPRAPIVGAAAGAGITRNG